MFRAGYLFISYLIFSRMLLIIMLMASDLGKSSWLLNFNRGNILKYIARAGKKKDELGDLLKAQDYLEREIQILRNN